MQQKSKRYFIELAYNGHQYFGWQRQPEQITIQQTLEDAFSTILGQPFEITGCGRTDTGVHARQYFAHFNFDGKYPKGFLSRINKFLPPDIAVYRLFESSWDAHARFDAYYRAYEYHITFKKDPFRQHLAYQYSYPQRPDLDRMQAAAALLLEFETFLPFCKTNHNAKSMQCELKRSEWEVSNDGHDLIYHIAANRFLRGMVRLIVGMCLNVGLGKIDLQAVRIALEQQEPLSKSSSAPPQGLYLTDIRYPWL